MIFDSKRRRPPEAESEVATVADRERRPDERSGGHEDTPPMARAAADARAEQPISGGGVGMDAHAPANRPVERQGADAGHAHGTGGTSESEREELEPLFPPDLAKQFRHGWDAVQIGFVDDPRQAVRNADELVKQVLQSLTETFGGERGRVEAQVAQADSTSTEDLRVALRRYRSFLHRLLSL